MINKRQIAIIHTLISKMQIPDDYYRDMLAAFGVSSSKNLSYHHATEFITQLVKKSQGKGVYNPTPNPDPRFNARGNRHGEAYPAQLRKIEAMWCEVSRMQTIEEKRAALNSFLKNKWNIERIEWLPKNLVGRVIKTIASMKGPSHE